MERNRHTGFPCNLALFVAGVLFACDDAYPIDPTPCDDWCYATQRAGCPEDYPEQCVSGCEQSGFLRDSPQCREQWRSLQECYLASPAESFHCHEETEVSQASAICLDERSRLAECFAPGGALCFSNCVHEAEVCDTDLSECEWHCRNPSPGCEDEQRQFDACMVGQPLYCGEPEDDPRELEEIPCLAEIGELLDCAGWND